MGTIRVPGEADPSAMQLQQMRKLYLFFPRGRPNAIIFTGAIGETEPAIRAAACEVFDFLGLQMIPKRTLHRELILISRQSTARSACS